MPSPPIRYPPPQQSAATVPTLRGPTSSSHLPAIAADRPRKTIATVKIQTTSESRQSSAAGVTTPNTRISAGL